jgi:ABC-2 type transport system permease protein
MTNRWFSLCRLRAVMLKEFIQMRRDRLTFAMIVGIPVMQLILFGYAINTDPKHLPTAVVCADHGPFSRALISALQITDYFQLRNEYVTEAQAEALLRSGEVQFVITIPADFNRRLLRGERPDLLLEADATDPASVGNAIATVSILAPTVLNREFPGTLQYLKDDDPPFNFVVHRRFNPDRHTQYNIVPGLLGVILTMTMVFITALAITRESERGTMENLLATPVRPVEVMIGKIVPYIFVGYIQITLILTGARILFDVPMEGSIALLLGISLFFVAANLAVGVTFSTIARNQLQAIQLSIFFFLPSLLLSGFMFPFRGMPAWAQVIGNILPLTHYLPIVRGILLKGNGPDAVIHNLWPIIAFLVVVMIIGIKRYRQTLD